MKKLLRLTALFLILASILTILPACGQKEKEKILITNVFKETVIKFPEDFFGNGNFNYNDLIIKNGNLYGSAYMWNQDYSENSQILFYLDSEDKPHYITELVSKNEENKSTNIGAMQVSEDGKVYLSIYHYEWSDESSKNSFELRVISEDGTYKSYEPVIENNENGDNLNVNNIAILDDGNVLLVGWDGIYYMDLSDSKLTKIDLDFDLGNSVNLEGVLNVGGVPYICIVDWSSSEQTSGFYPFDVKTKKFGEKVTFDNISDQYFFYSAIEGEGYDFYYTTMDGVMGYDIETATETEVLNYLNSDINSNNINRIVPASRDKIYAVTYDDITGGTNIVRLDRIPDEDASNKKVISLAATNLYYNMRNNIIRFNKSSDEYRIVVKEYSKDIDQGTGSDVNENSTSPADLMSKDIMSGNVPDMILITSDIPYSDFVARGIFYDLNKLIDNDESFVRSDYIDNVLEALEIGDSLYSLAPRIYINTLSAKESLLNGRTRWTIDEFIQFAKDHPDISMLDYEMTRSGFLSNVIMMSDEFVDYSTGDCHFDSPEFGKLLEFAKTLPANDFWSNINYEEVGDDFWKEYENRFTDNKVLLASTYFYSLWDSYKSLITYTLHEEPVFIGYPSNSGNGAYFSSDMEIAITSKCKDKDGAWAFIKSLISEDALMPINTNGYWNNIYGIPILKKAFDKCIEIAMTPVEDDDFAIARPYVKYSSVASTETISVATEVVEPIDTDVLSETVEDGEGSEQISTETAEIGEETKKVPDETDENGDGTADASEASEDTEIDISIETEVVDDDYLKYRKMVMTEAQKQKILDLVYNTKHVMRTNQKLINVITEDSEAYFAGEKSLEETLRIIQDRATTIINE